MTTIIVLALLNGCCISFCRILNGRLSQGANAFTASLWNHAVGFIFLSFVVYFTASEPVGSLANAPAATWLGGVIGALFVALNSYVLTRVGATLTALLVISGQLITGVIWEAVSHGADLTQVAGVMFILAGVVVAKFGNIPGIKSKAI